MTNKLLSTLRFLLYKPRHSKKRPISPDFRRMAPMEWTLMFSGQMMHRRYYPEKNGVREEYIVW
jgi:hypothetical protein